MFFQQLLYSLIKYLLENKFWHVYTAKAGLKLNIQRTNIMASGPITSWQIDGEKVETVIDFIFLGFKITVVSDCSHEIKIWLLLGRKTMTNLDSILNRNITFLTKVCIIFLKTEKAMVFPVVMHGWESNLGAEDTWMVHSSSQVSPCVLCALGL